MAEREKKPEKKEKQKEKKSKRDKKDRKDKKLADSYHWADRYADIIIQKKGDKKEYVVEAGITPSGTIHMGNFREIITADLIRRALEEKGKKVRFLYVWDDYDVLRKVPANLPKQEMIRENLRKPIWNIPVPYGCHESYALHFEKEVEKDLPRVDIHPEYVYNHEPYLKSKYAEMIKIALEKTEDIKKILNKYRKEDLKKDWLPIFVFCDKCGRDTTKIRWLGGYKVKYSCECGESKELDLRKAGNVTLRWRVDWPMRWHYNKVDFESAGKDHFAAGGSVTTSREIQKEIYGTEPPFGFAYEWIGIKGGKQFSSSTGNIITLHETLNVYEPEIVRYLFARTRPNAEFRISFDLDVLKIYEDFDRCERVYYEIDKAGDKEKLKQKRIYELSFIGKKIPKTTPYQPSFRHLTNILLINRLNIEKTIGYYENELKNDHDKKRLKQRAACAKHWLIEYAPDDFKYEIQEIVPENLKLGKKEKEALQELGKKLEEKDWTAQDLHEEIYVICTNAGVEAKDFFKVAYKVLIAKEKGPRLASFILEIGKDKVKKLLKEIK